MSSRLQDVLLRGTAAARPLATAVANGTLYYATDTATTTQSDGAAWHTYADSPASGPPALHAPTHASGGTDPVTLAQSQITGLTTALAAKLDTTDPSVTNARTPTAHATTHSSGGTDPVTVTNLAGYPGGTTTYLRADGTFGTPPGTGGSGTVTHTAGALALNNLTVGNASADLKTVAATDGQIPIGKTSDGSVTLAVLTAGTNITITNAAGAVTIAATTPARTGAIELVIDGGGSAITTGVKAYLEVPVSCTITAATLLADVSGSVVVDVWKIAYASYPPTVTNKITSSTPPTISAALKSRDTTLASWTTAITAGDILGINVNSATTITRVTLSLTVTVP